MQAARFCTNCGYSIGGAQARGSHAPAPAFAHQSAAVPDAVDLPAQWARLQRVGALFALLLLCSFVLGMIARGSAYAGGPGPWLEVVMSAIDAIVVAVFAVAGFDEFKNLLGVPRINAGILLKVLAAVGVFVLAVSVYFKLFKWTGGVTLQLTRPFLASHWPSWSIYAVICVVPAIVEEITFRGIIQSSLERVFSGRDAWLIQAALFGLLHLSPFMFPSHFIMGLCFGFVRNRTKSLYPGMLVHGAWNAWVVFSEL